MHAPTTLYLDAVYRILQQMKNSPSVGLLYSRQSGLFVEGYTNADQVSSVTNRRSTLGYCTFVGSNLVTQRSKKQSVVARFSVDAEFRSMAYGVCKLLWLRHLFSELGFPITSPMRVYYDNKAAISIAHNPVQHDCTKHIEVDRHSIEENLFAGIICTHFVKTGDQLANVFIKGLRYNLFHSLVGKLGLSDIYHRA